MPMTPGFQPLPATTMAFSSAMSRDSSSCSAVLQIVRSISRRSVLSRSSSSASLSACARSSAVKSATPVRADSMRPAALSRGASKKPRWPAVIFLSLSPATSTSAATPGSAVASMRAMPCLTMRRFSPRSGTMSATVPSATSSRSSVKADWPSHGFPDRTAARAWQSLKATPTPARSLSGYGQSARCGLSTAQAGGSSLPGRWWSVMMMSSLPAPCTAATSATEAMPQSTVTSRSDCSASSSSARRLRP